MNTFTFAWELLFKGLNMLLSVNKSHFLKMVALGLVLLASFTPLSFAEDVSLEHQFAKRVLLGTEYGMYEGVCSRWTKSPKLSLFGATSEEEQMVSKVVAEINEALQTTSLEIQLYPPENDKASMKLYFAHPDEFARLAEENGFDYEEGNNGFFYLWWNNWHEIKRAIIVIDHEASLEQKTHFLFEEITQSLGLVNDEPFFSDSVFYSFGSDGGHLTNLSSLDRKLIQFFYHHVSPGHKADDLEKMLDRHWN